MGYTYSVRFERSCDENEIAFWETKDLKGKGVVLGCSSYINSNVIADKYIYCVCVLGYWQLFLYPFNIH